MNATDVKRLIRSEETDEVEFEREPDRWTEIRLLGSVDLRRKP